MDRPQKQNMSEKGKMHNISLASKWQIPFVGPFPRYNFVLVSTATCAACVLWKRQLSPPLTGGMWSGQRWPTESHPQPLCDSGIVGWISLAMRSEEKFVRTSGEEASPLVLEHFLTERGTLPGWAQGGMQSQGGQQSYYSPRGSLSWAETGVRERRARRQRKRGP